MIPIFWIGCLSLTHFTSVALSQNLAVKKPELKFETLALGHSGILLFWDPSKEQNSSNVKYHFYFQRADNSSYAGRRRDTYTTTEVDDGQVKISNLEENVKYKIIIERRVKRERSTEYVIEAKTDVKSNKRPAKPDFKYIQRLQYDHTLIAIIIWLPCGKDRNCKGEVAGTHFTVKYKLKNSKNFFKLSYLNDDRFRIRNLFPGKTYEVVVSSVNNDLETESVSQEIFVPPTTGPVQSVKLLPLGTSAFLITWRPPRDGKETITSYTILYGKYTGDILYENNNFRDKNVPTTATGEEIQAKISKISANTNYTIFILPLTESGIGTEYQIDTIPQLSSSLPLAKPELAYEFEDVNSLPKIKIRWFPCGKLKDCKGTRPGSEFIVKYKSTDDSVYNTLPESDNDYLLIYNIVPNQKYEFIVTSVDKSDHADSTKVNIVVPSFGHATTVIDTIQGLNVTLPCKVTRSSKSKIQWYVNGNLVKYNDRVFKNENGDLKVIKASFYDMAKFSCSDENEPSKENATTFLIVRSPTAIENVNEFNVRQVALKEKVNLVCQIIKDEFLGVDIKWLKDGKDQGGSLRDTISPDHLMKVLSVSVDGEQHFGNYTCVAKSRLDEDRATVSLVKKK